MSVKGSETGLNAQPAGGAGTISLHGPTLFKKPPELKRLGGSQSDDWNNQIANQTINTLRTVKTEEGDASAETKAAIVGLCGIDPKDELEGMIAAQLIAGHNAAMECYRRAMHPNQTFEGRRENLTQANKLSRTYTMLLDSLNRHRGKGQQKVTVEHVHVYKGGQAIVGHVGSPGGGLPLKLEDQPHALQIEDAPEPPMRCANPERETLSVAVDAKRAMPLARGTIARRSKGK
jgi:hypothetical protein